MTQNTNRINLETEQETIEKLSKFCFDYKDRRNTFCIVVRNSEGILETHNRISRPCYGEMRNYKEKSLNRPGDRFPSDLINNFPNGTPCAVAIPLHNNDKDMKWMMEKLFSEWNPWLGKNEEFTKNLIFTTNKKGETSGVIINSGDLPPTFLVATFMAIRTLSKQKYELYKQYIQYGISEKDSFLLSLISILGLHKFLNIIQNAIISSSTNIFKYLNQEPIDLDDGLLWSDRCDYNRPFIMYAFCDGFEKDNISKVKKPMHVMAYDGIENIARKFNLVPLENVLKAA